MGLPFGWPPHQMLAWQGLLNYGYDARWPSASPTDGCYTITQNAARL